MVNLLKVLVLPPFGYYAPWVTSKKEDSKESSTKTSSHVTVPEQPGQNSIPATEDVTGGEECTSSKGGNKGGTGEFSERVNAVKEFSKFGYDI
jgi:hypothetical protein